VAAGDSIGRHLTALEGEGATIDRRAGRRQKFLDMGTGL
jgi:hypothetical protein